MNEKPNIKDHLILREIDNELAIYDNETGEFHFINQTGAVIFELCDSTNTVEDIVWEISDIFSKAPVNVEREVYQFLSSLTEKQLIN